MKEENRILKEQNYLRYKFNAHFYVLFLFLLPETWHNALSCNYVIDGYSLYFLSIKINQNDDMIIHAKNYLKCRIC